MTDLKPGSSNRTFAADSLIAIRGMTISVTNLSSDLSSFSDYFVQSFVESSVGQYPPILT